MGRGRDGLLPVQPRSGEWVVAGTGGSVHSPSSFCACEHAQAGNKKIGNPPLGRGGRNTPIGIRRDYSFVLIEGNLLFQVAF